MSSMRPIIVAGPIERNSNPRNSGSELALAGGTGGSTGPRPCAHTMPAVLRHVTAAINHGDTLRLEALTNIICSIYHMPPHRCESLNRHLHLNRSEEHTTELQSLRHLVCRLLLE